MFSSHGGFLTILTIARNNLIKLTHYDETKKTAHDSQIFRATENLKLSHGGPSQRQASSANQLIKTLRQGLLKWKKEKLTDVCIVDNFRMCDVTQPYNLN